MEIIKSNKWLIINSHLQMKAPMSWYVKLITCLEVDNVQSAFHSFFLDQNLRQCLHDLAIPPALLSKNKNNTREGDWLLRQRVVTFGLVLVFILMAVTSSRLLIQSSKFTISIQALLFGNHRRGFV